jgi:GxxExxY protein
VSLDELIVLNKISGQIVDAAIRVHSALGPGLLESTYEACLAYELRKRGLTVGVQVALPVEYEKVRVEAGYRIDLLVEDTVLVELKSVDSIHPIHRAQLLSYLRRVARGLAYSSTSMSNISATES